MKSDDEIMAEHLLQGARMLARACPDCGCPLFEVKGETVCVVCSAKATGVQKGSADSEPLSVTGVDQAATPPVPPAMMVAGPVRDELATTIVALLQRIRTEPDPQRCLVLLKCVRIAWDLA
jgi:UPF0148 protein